VGPRTNFSTAFSTNAASICASVGLSKVTRLERSRRYLLTSTRPLSSEERAAFAALVHDRMTEQVYAAPAATFAVSAVPPTVFTVPVLKSGRAALEAVNQVGVTQREATACATRCLVVVIDQSESSCPCGVCASLCVRRGEEGKLHMQQAGGRPLMCFKHK
jgi:Formylglycinamide ribonucleotide amidotransferase N-terminal